MNFQLSPVTKAALEGSEAFVGWYYCTEKTIREQSVPMNPYVHTTPYGVAWRAGWNRAAKSAKRNDLTKV